MTPRWSNKISTRGFRLSRRGRRKLSSRAPAQDQVAVLAAKHVDDLPLVQVPVGSLATGTIIANSRLITAAQVRLAEIP
jgi:hypothetical protein